MSVDTQLGSKCEEEILGQWLSENISKLRVNRDILSNKIAHSDFLSNKVIIKLDML